MPPSKTVAPVADLPHDAKLEAKMARWERPAFVAYGALLAKQGHPLAAVVAADLAADSGRASPAAKKHAAAVFADYVAAHLAPRFKALAPRMTHFTSKEADPGQIKFKHGFARSLDSFMWTPSMRAQLMPLLADPHAAWIVRLTPRGIALTDLDAIGRLVALRTLSFRWTKMKAVRSLAPLAKLRELRAIDLNDVQVSDHAPLGKLPLLQLIPGIKLGDLRPFAAHPTLEHLAANGSQVNDIGPLLSCKKLVNVGLYKTKVTKADVEKLIASMKKRGTKPTNQQDDLIDGYRREVWHDDVSWR